MSEEPRDDIAADISAVARLDAVPTILQVLHRTTGMPVVLIARVTPNSWTICAVLDNAGWNLTPGDQWDVSTTFCQTVTDAVSPVLVQHATTDPRFSNHAAHKIRKIESYIGVPLRRRDGRIFGTLCALSPSPISVDVDAQLAIFRLLADLIALQLETGEEGARREQRLAAVEKTSEFRERLMAVLGHDLRDPLNGILLMANALMRVAELRPEQVQLATRIGQMPIASRD